MESLMDSNVTPNLDLDVTVCDSVSEEDNVCNEV